MTFTLRPCVIPDDCARMADLINTVNTEPITAEQVEERHSAVSAGAVVEPMLVCGEGDRLVGYGVIRRSSHDTPGRFALRVMTHPGCRGRGAASLLYDHLLTRARAHGATQLGAMVREDDPAALAWAQKRGFTVDRHTFESVLDLAQFDAAPFAGAVEAAAATGIRFFSLADDPSEANLRRFYDLVWGVTADIPGLHFASPPPYEEWGAKVLNAPKVRHDLFFVAADGDQWVGFTLNVISPANGSAYNGGTGLVRGYRGRGIAQALKLLAIRQAQATGVPYMRTNNDAQNAPMLAVNRKLGFQPAPGIYELVRPLLNE